MSILKVFLACLLVLGVMGVLVDHMTKAQAEPQIVMCRITDINKDVHDMPCKIVNEYLEVK